MMNRSHVLSMHVILGSEALTAYMREGPVLTPTLLVSLVGRPALVEEKQNF